MTLDFLHLMTMRRDKYHAKGPRRNLYNHTVSLLKDHMDVNITVPTLHCYDRQKNLKTKLKDEDHHREMEKTACNKIVSLPRDSLSVNKIILSLH